MGATGRREQPSERKRTANAENARRPRLGARKPTPDQEVALREALSKVRCRSLPYAVDLLDQILRDELVVDGQRVPVPLELRAAVARDLADRAGVVRRTGQDVTVKSSGERELVVVGGGLGWPGLEEPAEDLSEGDHEADDAPN